MFIGSQVSVSVPTEVVVTLHVSSLLTTPLLTTDD